MNVTWGKKAATGVLGGLLMTSGLTLATAAPAAAAGAKYTCKATPSLSLGRPVSTSACKKSAKGKSVKKHRAVLVCDVVRGRGAEHTIPWTVKGKLEEAQPEVLGEVRLQQLPAERQGRDQVVVATP